MQTKTSGQPPAVREGNSIPGRKVFLRLSIFEGNFWQLAGIGGAIALLTAAPSFPARRIASLAMVTAWILLYFSGHAIAHWAVGRILGIRFVGYTVGGTGNPSIYAPGIRWVFAHLPFFGVWTDKASMQRARPWAKAIMWSSGVTASAVVPTLGAICARWKEIAGSRWFLLFAVAWAVGTLASNWTSGTGDFTKAKRALAEQ